MLLANLGPLKNGNNFQVRSRPDGEAIWQANVAGFVRKRLSNTRFAYPVSHETSYPIHENASQHCQPFSTVVPKTFLPALQNANTRKMVLCLC